MTAQVDMPVWGVLILLAVVVWELAWRYVACWRAARNGQKGWFFTMLLLNTFGLLPIYYRASIHGKTRLSTRG